MTTKEQMNELVDSYDALTREITALEDKREKISNRIDILWCKEGREALIEYRNEVRTKR